MVIQIWTCTVFFSLLVHSKSARNRAEQECKKWSNSPYPFLNIIVCLLFLFSVFDFLIILVNNWCRIANHVQISFFPFVWFTDTWRIQENNHCKPWICLHGQTWPLHPEIDGHSLIKGRSYSEWESGRLRTCFLKNDNYLDLSLKCKSLAVTHSDYIHLGLFIWSFFSPFFLNSTIQLKYAEK